MDSVDARPAILAPDCHTADEWFCMGERCLSDKSACHDFEQAVFCFLRASELGHERAQACLDELSAEGKGVVLPGHEDIVRSPEVDGADASRLPVVRPVRARLKRDARRCPLCGAMVYRRHRYRDGSYVCERGDGGCGGRLYIPIKENGLRAGLALQPYIERRHPVVYTYFGRCVHEVKCNKALTDDEKKILLDEAAMRIQECCVIENLMGGRLIPNTVISPAPSSVSRRLQPVNYLTSKFENEYLQYVELLRKHSDIESKNRPHGAELAEGDVTCSYWLEGRTILLVDDTYGEGATLRACIRELKRYGAGDIYFLSLCANTYGRMKRQQ